MAVAQKKMQTMKANQKKKNIAKNRVRVRRSESQPKPRVFCEVSFGRFYDAKEATK